MIVVYPNPHHEHIKKYLTKCTPLAGGMPLVEAYANPMKWMHFLVGVTALSTVGLVVAAQECYPGRKECSPEQAKVCPLCFVSLYFHGHYTLKNSYIYLNKQKTKNKQKTNKKTTKKNKKTQQNPKSS